jgi:hypothetical protein
MVESAWVTWVDSMNHGDMTTVVGAPDIASGRHTIVVESREAAVDMADAASHRYLMVRAAAAADIGADRRGSRGS